MMLAQIETALQGLDHAAQQDMRWWFLGSLLAMAGGIIALARYWAAERNKLSERLDKVQDERTEYLERNNAALAGALAESAGAMREFAHAVAAVRHLFEPPRRDFQTAGR